MPDKPPEKHENSTLQENNGEKEKFPLAPAGEVVLTHYDSPPPSGKQRIHQRRPLPRVPDRKNAQEDKNDQDC